MIDKKCLKYVKINLECRIMKLSVLKGFSLLNIGIFKNQIISTFFQMPPSKYTILFLFTSVHPYILLFFVVAEMIGLGILEFSLTNILLPKSNL